MSRDELIREIADVSRRLGEENDRAVGIEYEIRQLEEERDSRVARATKLWLELQGLTDKMRECDG